MTPGNEVGKEWFNLARSLYLPFAEADMVSSARGAICDHEDKSYGLKRVWPEVTNILVPQLVFCLHQPQTIYF